jgi:hypothetical protein
MKFRILSTSVLLATLSGCTLNDEGEATGAVPGPWVNSDGTDDGTSAAAGGSPSSPVSAATGGMPAGDGAGAGGVSWDCEGTVAACYADAYTCCGQGIDEQCEILAGACASILCPQPYPDPSSGETGGFGAGGAYSTGGAGGYGGDEEVPDSSASSFHAGGHATGGGPSYGAGGTGAGGPVIPGFCSGVGGGGGYGTGGGPASGEGGGYATGGGPAGGEGGEGGYATGGMPAQ